MNEDIVDVLNAIIFYNGIYEPLLKVKEDIIKQDNEKNYMYFTDNNKHKFETNNYEQEQFEIFWMMLVLLYGNYGTSPRSGWLEMKNKDKIIKFIDDITKLSLEGIGD